MPQQRQHEHVHVPGHRLQPVDQQQTAHGGVAQQIPHRGALLARRGRHHRRARRAAQQRPAQQRQRRHQPEGPAVADQIARLRSGAVDQQPGHQRAGEVGRRRCDGDPAEGQLALGGVAGQAADVALQRDLRRVGRRPHQQRRGAQHGKHRPGRRQPGAQHGRRHRQRQRQVQAVAIGQAPGRQRQKHRRQRKQRQQHAHRRRAVAELERQERRRQPGAGHGAVHAHLRQHQAQHLAAAQGHRGSAFKTATALAQTAPAAIDVIALKNCPRRRRRRRRPAAAAAPARRAGPRRGAARGSSRWCASARRPGC